MLLDDGEVMLLNDGDEELEELADGLAGGAVLLDFGDGEFKELPGGMVGTVVSLVDGDEGFEEVLDGMAGGVVPLDDGDEELELVPDAETLVVANAVVLKDGPEVDVMRLDEVLPEDPSNGKSDGKVMMLVGMSRLVDEAADEDVVPSRTVLIMVVAELNEPEAIATAVAPAAAIWRARSLKCRTQEMYRLGRL